MSGKGTSSMFPDQHRGDRLLREMDHDPYHAKAKLKPTQCPECGAVFHHGRWAWGEALTQAHEEMCPACRRIHDKVPAAFLNLSGEFFKEHRQEIVNLIHNYEQREKREHPLKRIMDIDDQADGWVITFTDAHLARGIGEALHKAYEGEIDYRYTHEDIMLRVNWSR